MSDRVRTWVNYSISLGPIGTTEEAEVRDRDITTALAQAPEGTIAIVFFDLHEPDFEYDRERFEVEPKAVNVGPHHFIAGTKVYTRDELKALDAFDGQDGIVTAMEEQQIEAVARLPSGLFMPTSAGAIVLEEPAAAA